VCKLSFLSKNDAEPTIDDYLGTWILTRHPTSNGMRMTITRNAVPLEVQVDSRQREAGVRFEGGTLYFRDVELRFARGELSQLSRNNGGQYGWVRASNMTGAMQVVLTLTASGEVSDYSDSDKSTLQRIIAAVAGVDKDLVTISVAPGSVIITATIAVPASTTAAEVLTSLTSTLGTAASASTALGITVESDPTAEIRTVSSSDGGDDTAVGGMVGGVIGGVVGGLLLFCFCLWVCWKKRQAKHAVSASQYNASSTTAQAHPVPIASAPVVQGFAVGTPV
jgi:hypothetical protein